MHRILAVALIVASGCQTSPGGCFTEPLAGHAAVVAPLSGSAGDVAQHIAHTLGDPLGRPGQANPGRGPYGLQTANWAIPNGTLSFQNVQVGDPLLPGPYWAAPHWVYLVGRTLFKAGENGTFQAHVQAAFTGLTGLTRLNVTVVSDAGERRQAAVVSEPMGDLSLPVGDVDMRREPAGNLSRLDLDLPVAPLPVKPLGELERAATRYLACLGPAPVVLAGHVTLVTNGTLVEEFGWRWQHSGCLDDRALAVLVDATTAMPVRALWPPGYPAVTCEA
ncbi:MAG: hypothetical protein ACYDBQ_00835 [Thermoplasmatota archaeon]